MRRWIFHYNSEMKLQTTQWKTSNSPTSKRAKIVRSTGKVMMIIFVDYKVSYNSNWGELYVSVLHQCCIITGINHQTRTPESFWTMIIHDRMLWQSFWTQNEFILFPSSLKPWICSVWLLAFPTIKKELKDKRFVTNQEVIKTMEVIWKTTLDSRLGFCIRGYPNPMEKMQTKAGGLFWKQTCKISWLSQQFLYNDICFINFSSALIHKDNLGIKENKKGFIFT